MKGHRDDLVGQVFGKLTVLKQDRKPNGRSAWLCRCECGKELVVYGYRLKTGRIKSCGEHKESIATGLVGMTFGYLTALQETRNKRGIRSYVCKCKCGATKVVSAYELLRGKTQSCGCLGHDITKQRNYRHGMAGERIYRIWAGMKTRCYNSHSRGYKYYGKKGVSVCEEWRGSFEKFYGWAVNNGYDENLTIDRIDSSKGYSPDNCRWVSMETQNRNKDSVVPITYNGKTMLLGDWAKSIGICYASLYDRIKRHGLEIALATPKNCRVASRHGEDA